MNKFHLLDVDHGKKAIKQDHLYETASKIVLKYGDLLSFKPEHIREFWKYEEPYPSPSNVYLNVNPSSIKWYVHNKITVDYPIWNSDFLHGLMVHCNIFWDPNNFPSCEWFNNDIITDLLKSCPFGGKIVQEKRSKRNQWIGVPALYLNHSTDSISFMAGVMAGIQVFKKDKKNYGVFGEKILPYFKAWGIPVEEKCEDGYLTSPIWPALFVKHMPVELSDKWLNLRKACNTNIYAPILWKTYMNNDFPVDGIPYLKCRRSIFYRFECEEGAMNFLDRMRIEKNLTILDNRIREIVKEWGKSNEILTN